MFSIFDWFDFDNFAIGNFALWIGFVGFKICTQNCFRAIEIVCIFSKYLRVYIFYYDIEVCLFRWTCENCKI